MILDTLPEPSADTPWEEILNFGRDPAALAALARLRKWMAKIAKDSPSPGVGEDELTALLHDYEPHMRLHRIKSERGTLEAFLTTTAEVASAIVTMKWGAAVKGPRAAEKN